MTPEQIRRILDPEQRRKGHEAWKAEQREQTLAAALRESKRSGKRGESKASQAAHDAGSSPVGAQLSSFAEPETRLRFPGSLSVSNPRFPSLADWLPTPEQTRQFWGDDPRGPRRKLADEMQRQRDDAEAELREALGKLVALRVGQEVRCSGVRDSPWPDTFAVMLEVDTEASPGVGPLRGFGEMNDHAHWWRVPTRDALQATLYILKSEAARLLRDVLGEDCLAAPQPKIESRDGAFFVTRKTLRKDVELLECLRGASAEKTAREVAASRGGRVVFVKALRKDGEGEWVDVSDPWLFLPGDSITSGGKIGTVLEHGDRSLRVRWDGPVLRRKDGEG